MYILPANADRENASFLLSRIWRLIKSNFWRSLNERTQISHEEHSVFDVSLVMRNKYEAIQNSPLVAVTVLLVALFALSGCDAWKSGPDPEATVIQDIRVEPNPVRVDSTATFTVITPDSLDPDLTYRWRISGQFETTNDPSITWVASVDPGQYSFTVRISRRLTVDVQRAFRVTVVANE